jgi:WXXGXW repeat (2 copies)
MNCNRATRWLLFAVMMIGFSAASQAQIAVGISVRIGPPALPVYAQPICPGPGYLWTPGYWAWNDDAGYYWVPGTWVVAPVGLLWTPGYWGWSGGLYVWHGGYWGPHVGFYGGINYGFGYGGVGFGGGEWRGGSFYYNRSVTNVNVTNVTNVYNKTVIVNNTNVKNVSYNGGEGGVTARPTPEEERAEHEHHQNALPAQQQHEHAASQNRENFASNNHGKPAIAATAKPGEFKGHGVVRAQAAGAPYHAPKMSPKEARGPAVSGNRPLTAKNTSNANHPMNKTPDRPTSQNRVSNDRGGNNGKSKQGFRSFNPPNNSRNSTSARNSSAPRPAASNGSRPAPQQASHAAPAPRHESAPPQHESRPAPQHESAPHQNAPRQEKEHHPGKGR